MLSLEDNIRAVIESCFSESKDELQNIAVNNIMTLIDNSRLIDADNLIQDAFTCRETTDDFIALIKKQLD